MLAYFVVIVSTNRVDSTIASQLLMHKHLREVSKVADTSLQPTQTNKLVTVIKNGNQLKKKLIKKATTRVWIKVDFKIM